MRPFNTLTPLLPSPLFFGGLLGCNDDAAQSGATDGPNGCMSSMDLPRTVTSHMPLGGDFEAVVTADLRCADSAELTVETQGRTYSLEIADGTVVVSAANRPLITGVWTAGGALSITSDGGTTLGEPLRSYLLFRASDIADFDEVALALLDWATLSAMLDLEGGERLVDTTISARLGHIQKGHAVAFADFDNDGDNDIFQQIGGSYIADKYPDALYLNPGHGNAWVSLKLVGTTTNRSAIGARITAEVAEGGQRRTIVRWVTSGGSYGGNPLTQLIGIGKAERLERLTVHWPGTEADQVFENVTANAHLQITEGEADFITLEVPRFAFPHAPHSSEITP